MRTPSRLAASRALQARVEDLIRPPRLTLAPRESLKRNPLLVSQTVVAASQTKEGWLLPFRALVPRLDPMPN